MADRKFYEQFRQTPEGQALLRTIRFAEGTERGGPDSYRVMFGGSLAPDLKRHPDVVMKGRSTAAGAYQFLTPTWNAAQKRLGLASFGPVEQDIAALDLARSRTMGLGGLSYLQKQGLTPDFVAALAPEWASLPTKEGKSYYGQPVKPYQKLQEVYGQGLKPLQTTDQASPGQQQQDLSSDGFLKGFITAMSGSNTKEVSIKDLLKQELMGQLLSPQTMAGPLDFLSSYLNPYA
jgi:muramidase (phage lysozyme)